MQYPLVGAEREIGGGDQEGRGGGSGFPCVSFFSVLAAVRRILSHIFSCTQGEGEQRPAPGWDSLHVALGAISRHRLDSLFSVGLSNKAAKAAKDQTSWSCAKQTSGARLRPVPARL